MGKRYEAYGWHVQDLEEDIGLDNLEQALETAIAVEDKPSLIIVRTHIAQGSPHKHDTAGAHGSPLGEEEVKLTKEHMGWPSLEPFYVPEDALKHFRRCIERGEELESDWRERFDAYGAGAPRARPGARAAVLREAPRRMGPGGAEVPRLGLDDGHAQVVGDRDPVGSGRGARARRRFRRPGAVDFDADRRRGAASRLAPTRAATSTSGSASTRWARSSTALTSTTCAPFGATFFIFSDYMRGSIRLAALMHLRSIFVFTHDSIGLGEDGPTHQPIEQLAGLRAMPVLRVVRPAGANETALAWHYAIKSDDHPTALVLSRQGVPTWNPSAVPADAIDRGAYVLRYSFNEPEPPQLILIATGTEVHICARAADALEAEGIATRLVSMPCMENFAAQDASYRDSVLPSDVRARVSLEAAATFGWHEWVGELGEAIGMEGFGASAPAGALYKHFGFTPERVADAGRAAVKRAGSSGAG